MRLIVTNRMNAIGRRTRLRGSVVPIVLSLAMPGGAAALTLSASPDLGSSVVPVVLDRGEAVSWGNLGDRPIGPDDPVQVAGCGGLVTPGVYYLDVPVAGFPAPSGWTDVAGRLLDVPDAAVPVAAAVGADVVGASGFVVRVAPHGAMPRDDLDLIGIELPAAQGDRIHPVRPDGIRSASRGLDATPSPVASIEVDPDAHLDDRATAFFAAFDPAAGRRGGGDGDAVLMRAAFGEAPAVASAHTLRSNAGRIGEAAFRDPDTPVVEQAWGRTAVGSDTVTLAAMDAQVERPIDLSGALVDLPEDSDTVWLYPSAGPGYLQEIDAKGTITFTSFRTGVELILASADCEEPVGADIVEIAAPATSEPLLGGLGPLPSILGGPGGGTPQIAGSPSSRTSNISSPPRRGSPGGVPGFPSGGGGGRNPPGPKSGGGEPPDAAPPPSPPPAPIPLPAGILLYGGALLLGATAWRLGSPARAKGTPT